MDWTRLCSISKGSHHWQVYQEWVVRVETSVSWDSRLLPLLWLILFSLPIPSSETQIRTLICFNALWSVFNAHSGKTLRNCVIITNRDDPYGPGRQMDATTNAMRTISVSEKGTMLLFEFFASSSVVLPVASRALTSSHSCSLSTLTELLQLQHSFCSLRYQFKRAQIWCYSVLVCESQPHLTCRSDRIQVSDAPSILLLDLTSKSSSTSSPTQQKTKMMEPENNLILSSTPLRLSRVSKQT